MIYLDSSALVKLALTEPETAALARWLAERADQPLVSSALYRAEVPRAIWCAEPTDRTSQGSARRRIGIRELRQHASVYVDLAEKGYTVDITNRGRLVAQLVPVFEPGSPLERLIAAGVLEPAEEPGGVGDIDPYPSPASGRLAASRLLGQAGEGQAPPEEAPREQAPREQAEAEERR